MKKRKFRQAISILIVTLLMIGMFPTSIFSAAENETIKNGYYQNGQWTEGSYTPTLPEGIRSVSKTAEKSGDNTYQITLEVVAEKRSTTTETAGAAATVLVIDRSGSMLACAECGLHRRMNGSYYHDSTCSYANGENYDVTTAQTRLTAMKNAANSFLDTYRGNASSDRWVNIVTFSDGASNSNWFDVATESGYNSAVQRINYIFADGNTNMYEGLRTANTVLSQNQVSNIAADDKNVVVLSDGAPNRAGYGSNTMQQVISQTTTQASTVKENAKIYTVCFGAATETTYYNGPTVGNFLRDSIASDPGMAFNADNTSELNAAFETIAESITSGLDGSGLIVTDEEAPFITAIVDGQEINDGFTWNLSNPVVNTETDGNTVITTYTYTKVYTVTLDANDADFVEGQWYPLNGETYLTMEDETRVDFPIPAGQGTKSRYTVRWEDEDGTLLEEDIDVVHGTTPSYDGDEPSKAATDEYTYSFSGWTPDISPVTGNITYTAQYEAVKNSYTVRWVDDDGTELEKDEDVEYGTMPSYDGAEPSKASTAEHTYTFTGWSPVVSPVTRNITYTAQYNAVKNAYTVRWVDDDETELEVDENVEYGTMPSYDSAEPSKAATAEYTYVFAGWNPTVSAVTSDITYTAQYNAVKNAYTVTWENDDGTVLEKDEGVAYGTMPSYDSAEPSKAATAEFTYTFTGWNPVVSPVTGNITYTAQYDAVKNAYTVTWLNDDGTLLELDEGVAYGTMPSYDGAEPSKAATDEYTYTFTGWNPVVSPVTGNITYTAQYDSDINTYTVRWVNEDGTELEVDENVAYGTMPSYDSATPSKAATAEFTYTFTGWNPVVSPVTGNITYTAQYSAGTNAYTVRWEDEDGTELEKDENVAYGTMPSYDSAEPSKAATAEFTYVFDGWNPEISLVIGDITYTAKYKAVKNAYTVRWVDEDNTELEKDENVEYGAMPSYDGAEPSKDSTAEYTYTFDGWNPEISLVTGDVTYTAKYKAVKNAYTVWWVDEDGTELEKDENVEYGQMPSYDSEEPTKAATAEFSYIFDGWNPEISAVTGDITYTAQYKAVKNAYTVRWVDEDGTELEKDENVEYGQMPSYDSDEPAKEATAEYTYTFDGWNPEVSEVTGDVTYTAQYTETRNAYTVTWVNDDGTVLETDENVPYGQMPSYDSRTPSKAATEEYTYTFEGWEPEISAVTGDITYKAVYTEKEVVVSPEEGEKEKDDKEKDDETPTVTPTRNKTTPTGKTSSGAARQSAGPKTGDVSMMIWLLLICIASGAIVGLFVYRRKSR